MKLFLTIISFIVLSMVPLKTQTRSPEQEAFYNNCYNAYSSYAAVTENETNIYDILILIGEHNSNVSYSIYFEMNTIINYAITIKHGDEELASPVKNSSGGFAVYKLNANKPVSIEIFNKSQNKLIHLYELEETSLDSYNETYKDKMIQGQNKGFSSIDDLNNKTKSEAKFTIILSSIFLGLILLSITIILVLAARKKGIFNQEFIDQEFEDEHKMRDQIKDYISQYDEDNIEVEAHEIKDAPTNTEIKNVYEKPKNYDFDEVRDISLILQEKGFNTNYSEMSNNDKNDVMLQLMKMRDTKEITDEEYRSEIIKLWM